MSEEILKASELFAFIQNTDTVYLDQPAPGFLNFRTHFFTHACIEYFGNRIYTYLFNVILLFLSSCVALSDII
jgi:hypothetical protein